MQLRTKACDFFGIEYPILQAGMGNVCRSDLVAAVSNAGGLGVLGAGTFSLEETVEEIRKVKQMTNRPFGFDMPFPARGPRRASDVQLPTTEPEAIRILREEMKERGVVVKPQPPGDESQLAKDRLIGFEHAQRKLQIALDEGISFLFCALGTQEWIIEACHARGTKVVSLVGNVRNAIRVVQMGADAMVVCGHEGGGHTGRMPLFPLIPQVVDAVNVPVVAAGSIVDGRGLVAALALGASGVWVGTRFIATPEAFVNPIHKQAILSAGENGTVWSLAYDGLGHRDYRNRYFDVWLQHQDEILPYPQQRMLTAPVRAAAEQASLGDYMQMSTGMGSAMINEIEPAAQIVREMVEQAVEILSEGFPRQVLFSR